MFHSKGAAFNEKANQSRCEGYDGNHKKRNITNSRQQPFIWINTFNAMGSSRIATKTQQNFYFVAFFITLHSVTPSGLKSIWISQNSTPASAASVKVCDTSS